MKGKKRNLALITYLLFAFGCSKESNQKIESHLTVKDSIVMLIKASKKKKNTNSDKLEYAKKALELSDEIKNDSSWFASLDRVTILQYRLRDFDAYKKRL